MKYTVWIVFILVIVTASFMLLDGTRALLVGDYMTPSTGAYAGQLGPWSMLVASVGIDPRSTFMKIFFILYGFLAIAFDVCFLLKFPWAKQGLFLVAILGLWYLPFGTITNFLAAITLLLPERKK